MSKHTPGPWQLAYDAVTQQWEISREHVYGPFVLVRRCEGQSITETEANARAISICPEMLEAINEADTAFAVLNLCDDLTPQARSALRSAWAKVQAVLVALSPDGALAEAVKETPDSALNVQKYLDSKGTICPFCGEEDIEGGPVETGNGKANQEMSCAACDKKWLDLYELVNIMTYEDGES